MTSYFEIGGHIVECSTAPQSSLSVSRTPLIKSRKAADSRIVGEDARPSSRTAVLSAKYSPRSHSSQVRTMLGSAMIRTGIAILIVPDPIPLIDEVVGAGLIYGGAYVMSTAE